MVYLSRMDLLEQDNTSGASQVEFRRLTTLRSTVPVLLEELLLPMWETTTSVRVGTPDHHSPVYCMQVTHSGMARGVDLLPAVS